MPLYESAQFDVCMLKSCWVMALHSNAFLQLKFYWEGLWRNQAQPRANCVYWKLLIYVADLLNHEEEFPNIGQLDLPNLNLVKNDLTVHCFTLVVAILQFEWLISIRYLCNWLIMAGSWWWCETWASSTAAGLLGGFYDQTNLNSMQICVDHQ